MNPSSSVDVSRRVPFLRLFFYFILCLMNIDEDLQTAVLSVLNTATLFYIYITHFYFVLFPPIFYNWRHMCCSVTFYVYSSFHFCSFFIFLAYGCPPFFPPSFSLTCCSLIDRGVSVISDRDERAQSGGRPEPPQNPTRQSELVHPFVRKNLGRSDLSTILHLLYFNTREHQKEGYI